MPEYPAGGGGGGLPLPSGGTYPGGTTEFLRADQTWAVPPGGSGTEPWQFMPESYGAKGDGRVVGDTAMSTGTPTVLTSATANFTSGDVGKNIVVNGALGSSNAPLYTTIASVTNSTTVVLSASATNTVTNAAAFWATDDSAAFVAALSAGSTWAQANTWKFQLVCQDKFYGLATLTTTAAGGSLAQQNALVPIPYPNVNGTTQKLCIEFIGVGESADEQYFGSTIPSMTGTALVATVAASGTSPSIIGGPNASTNLPGTWVNVKFTTRGVAVWAGFNPGWIGWDLRQLASCWVDNAAAQVLAPPGGGQNPGLGTIPANTSGTGFIFPSNNDNGAGRVMAEGFYESVALAPRTTIEKLFTQSSGIAVFLKTVNSTVVHGARIGYWSCNIATTAIQSTATSGTMPLVVGLFDSSGTITTDLSDPHGTIVGSMNWWHTSSTGPTVVAGSAMKINNLRLNPGPMASPPAAPSSGFPSTAIWRDTEVTLSLSGGTLTALLIDAVDQHIPAGCVLWKFTLPSGHTYTPTYTGTLATDVAVMWMPVNAGFSEYGVAIAPAVVALTDAATVTVNAALGNVFTLLTTSGVGSTRAIGVPSNPVDGQIIRFRITQAASGGPYAATWNSAYDFGSGSAPGLTATASKTDVLAFEYIATNSLNKWVYLGAAVPQGF